MLDPNEHRERHLDRVQTVITIWLVACAVIAAVLFTPAVRGDQGPPSAVSAITVNQHSIQGNPFDPGQDWCGGQWYNPCTWAGFALDQMDKFFDWAFTRRQRPWPGP
jgi:hypothetical protein